MSARESASAAITTTSAMMLGMDSSSAMTRGGRWWLDGSGLDYCHCKGGQNGAKPYARHCIPKRKAGPAKKVYLDSLSFVLCRPSYSDTWAA
jgi:hypothetical protein